MSEDESIARLRTLGLNLYESRAYLALLNGKELTAKGVGQSALIPQSRTYDVLESLTRKGFAHVVPASPPAYVPIAPDKALSQHFESERGKIKSWAAKVQEDAQAKLDAIQDAYLGITREFPKAQSQFQGGRDRVWVLRDRENIENALSGYIRDAKSQVLRVTRPPEPSAKNPLDPFYIMGMENKRFIDQALERNVEMRWLSLSREIPTFQGLEITEPPERRYLHRDDDIAEKFFLVDGRHVLLNLHDPISSGFGHIALAMESTAATSIFLDHFEKMWRKATPLSVLLPRARRLVEEVASELEDSGFEECDALVYKTLARLGAVPQDVLLQELSRRRARPSRVLASTDRLMKSGLVHRDQALRLLMVEHPLSAKRLLRADPQLPQRQDFTIDKPSSGKNP